MNLNILFYKKVNNARENGKLQSVFIAIDDDSGYKLGLFPHKHLRVPVIICNEVVFYCELESS